MALHDNTYSRAVAWLKVLLPLLALGILSTLFLLSRTVEPSQTLPYADVDAQEFAREQRVGAPDYSGVTANGAAISLIAESARPRLDRPEIIDASKLDARIKQTDGTVLDIRALAGTFNSEVEDALLTGGVRVTISTGYEMETEKLTALLDGSEMQTDTAVVVEGPEGRIEAGSMHMQLKSSKDDRRGYVVVFNGGVKLIYTPKDNVPGSP